MHFSVWKRHSTACADIAANAAVLGDTVNVHVHLGRGLNASGQVRGATTAASLARGRRGVGAIHTDLLLAL